MTTYNTWCLMKLDSKYGWCLDRLIHGDEQLANEILNEYSTKYSNEQYMIKMTETWD